MIYLMGTTDRRWQISRLSFLVTLQQVPTPSPVHPGASQTWWSVSQTPTTRSKGEPPNAQTPTTCWTISGDIITLLPCLLKRHLAWHLSKAHLSSRVRIRHHPLGSCILFHPSPIHTRFPRSIGCWTTRWPGQPSYRLGPPLQLPHHLCPPLQLPQQVQHPFLRRIRQCRACRKCPLPSSVTLNSS